MSIEKKFEKTTEVKDSESIIHLDEIIPDLKTGWKEGRACHLPEEKEIEKALEIDEKYLEKVKKEIIDFEKSLEEKNPQCENLDKIYDSLSDYQKRLIEEEYDGKEKWITDRKNINLDYVKILEKKYEDSEFTKKEISKEAYITLYQNDWKIHKWKKSEYYLPIIAIIQKMFKEDLKDKMIAEIGPGIKGETALAYLSSKGAKVIGIDKFLKKGRFSLETESIKGEWENVPLKRNQIDAIYVVRMSPQDWEGKEEKEKEVAKNIKDSLKTNGFFLNAGTSADHRLSFFALRDTDYSVIQFKMKNPGTEDTKILIAQKPKKE